MNRVLGDYFETLLYKIFVSIDERTTIHQLASVLQINIEMVKVCHTLFLSSNVYLNVKLDGGLGIHSLGFCQEEGPRETGNLRPQSDLASLTGASQLANMKIPLHTSWTKSVRFEDSVLQQPLKSSSRALSQAIEFQKETDGSRMPDVPCLSSIHSSVFQYLPQELV